MKPNFQDFFKQAMRKYEEPELEEDEVEEDRINQANIDIKAKLDLHIRQMAKKSLGDLGSIRLQIKEADRIRVEQEVEELLAEEQRSTSMGQWA